MIDAAAGGTLNNKTLEAAQDLIEDIGYEQLPMAYYSFKAD